VKPDVKKITHAAIYVRDVDKSARWYEKIMGLNLHVRNDYGAFMSFGKKHHDIVLMPADGTQPRGAPGLHHLSFEIGGGVEALRRLYAMLLDNDVEIVKISDHKVGWGIYFNDPDGNTLEFFCELVTDDDEGRRVFHEAGAPSEPMTLEPLR
jgi:catechol 2,3-dioxygenase